MKNIPEKELFSEIKEKIINLNFKKTNLKMIMEDMKQNENILLYLREVVSILEIREKKLKEYNNENKQPNKITEDLIKIGEKEKI
jgi:hypothetical protein